jgi:hypothetical protein
MNMKKVEKNEHKPIAFVLYNLNLTINFQMKFTLYALLIKRQQHTFSSLYENNPVQNFCQSIIYVH